MRHGRWLMGILAAAAAASPATAAAATLTVAGAPAPRPVHTPAFRQVAGSPFPAGAGPTAVAFSTDGRFLAVADYQLNAVSMYAVSERGRLSRVPGSPFPTGAGPVALAFSPSGETLLVADLGADELTIDAVSTTGGLSTARSPRKLAGPPYDVSYSADGRMIATADSTADTVELIRTDPRGDPGTLGTRQALAAGSDPTSVAFSPDGRVLAVSEHGAAAIAAFGLSGPGRLPILTPLSGSPAPTSAPTDTVSFNREGNLVAASDYNAGQVDLLSLSPAGIAPAADGAIPTGPGSGPDSARFSPVSDRLAVALGTANQTALYQAEPTATPSPLVGSPLASGTGPAALAFNPQGTLVATANIYSNSVSIYASTAPPPAVVRLMTGRATLHGHRVALTLTCAAIVDRSAGHACRGTLTLTRQGRRVSRAHFSIAPGVSTTLALALPRQITTLTAAHHKVKLLQTVTATGAPSAQRALSVTR